jgi:predicted transcriptional regulator
MLKEKEQRILNLLLNGPLTAKQIMQQLGIKKAYCYRLLKGLQEKDFIKKSGNEYVITLLGKRVVQETEVKKARVHNIRVVCHVEDADYERIREIGKEVQMKNWLAYYIDIADICSARKIPVINAKVRINVAKATTAMVHLPEFYAGSRPEAEVTIQNMFNKVRRILQLERIVILDDWIRVKYIFGEYAFEVEEPLDPGTEVDLGRNALDPTGKELPIRARAWVDDSNGREVDANCAGYTENYLLMPERVAKIEKKLDEYDGFLYKVERAVEKIAETTEKVAEASEKQAELGVMFAENLNTHIPYVKSAETALVKITEIMELQQQAIQSQNKMIELLSNHIMNNGNNGSSWAKLAPFLLMLLLLVATVKGVGF